MPWRIQVARCWSTLSRWEVNRYVLRITSSLVPLRETKNHLIYLHSELYKRDFRPDGHFVIAKLHNSVPYGGRSRWRWSLGRWVISDSWRNDPDWRKQKYCTWREVCLIAVLPTVHWQRTHAATVTSRKLSTLKFCSVLHVSRVLVQNMNILEKVRYASRDAGL